MQPKYKTCRKCGAASEVNATQCSLCGVAFLANSVPSYESQYHQAPNLMPSQVPIWKRPWFKWAAGFFIVTMIIGSRQENETKTKSNPPLQSSQVPTANTTL